MRLFVAVWPPADVVDRLAALPRPPLAGVRWTGPDQWHVTLRFLGSVDDGEEAVRALGAVAAAGPAVEAVMGPATVRFAGGRVLSVPVAGLDAVAAGVVAATMGVGEPPDDRPFRGHLTLARARGQGRPRVDWAPVEGLPVAGRWAVTEVALVESRLHPSGARYETVATVPLLPPSPPPEGA